MAENNGIQNQTRISFRKKLSLIIFGLLISFVLLEAGLRLGGFIISSLQEDRNQASLKQKASYRIMCLGESTTAMGGRYSYPSQLEMVLNERDEGMKFSVIYNSMAYSPYRCYYNIDILTRNRERKRLIADKYFSFTITQ